jgi:two-component system sensor histidine kinase ChvG
VQAEVVDDGPGIPDGREKEIFNRFYSERPKSETFGVHSGLGLSISKQIIDAHGGNIFAENRRQADGRVVGARFVVELPAT